MEKKGRPHNGEHEQAQQQSLCQSDGEAGNTQGALEDFREARQLAIVMRADIVPADHDRITLENRVSRIHF